MKTFLHLAATTDLNTGLGKVVGLLQNFSLVLTFSAVILGAISIMSGHLEYLRHILIGGAISGLGWILLVELFKLGGVDVGVQPQPF